MVLEMATYISNISADDIRILTGLSASDITDEDLNILKAYAATYFNHDVQIEYKDWRVESIDSFRENEQDDNNTTYWLPYYPIGDHNDDGSIDSGDVEAYVIEPDDGTGDSAWMKTSYTVSEIIDDEWGKISLTSAPPSNGSLYFSWHSCPIELETPHPAAKLAIAQLTAALASSKLDVGKVANFRVGKVSVTKKSPDYQMYMTEYGKTITQIKSGAFRSAEYDLIV